MDPIVIKTNYKNTYNCGFVVISSYNASKALCHGCVSRLCAQWVNFRHKYCSTGQFLMLNNEINGFR